MNSFEHIHSVLVSNGYLEVSNNRRNIEWYIRIDYYDRPRIIGHWYDCSTMERAKVAVKSLLNKTDIYTVVVYSPNRVPVSFSGHKFTKAHEREWKYYYRD